ncbi:hypothetical protein DESA109040_22720 [Deinococcus saxicola]|uniref:hypothetical protein n=1 Tax=Deinococcus saxicola TaxID=249406 RepID=UPI0039EFCA1B
MHHPKLSLWAMDEHRVGLKPILKTVWAPTGQPLVCPVQPRYEWLYIYAFVNPETGESRFWPVPEVSELAYHTDSICNAVEIVTAPISTLHAWNPFFSFSLPSDFQVFSTPFNRSPYQRVMVAFARRVEAGEQRCVLVVEDGAGFYLPLAEGHPPGIQTITLPAYSPELQPVERLWDPTDASGCQPLV